MILCLGVKTFLRLQYFKITKKDLKDLRFR
jgi:hypothetical protein